MSKRPFLSIVIPVYNEAKRLPLMLIDIDKYFSESKYSYEIIVIDDGSTDETKEFVEKFKSLIPHLKVVSYPENRGKGAALKVGITEAIGEYKLFVDTDNFISPDQFENIVPFLKNGYDVVMCSMAREKLRLAFSEKSLGQIFEGAENLIIKALVLPGILDVRCGFKYFSEKAIEEIFPLQRVNRWGFDVEILALAQRAGLKIKQIPVEWVGDRNRHANASVCIRTTAKALKIRWWLWRGHYSRG